MKASYRFIDRAYVRLDATSTHYVVELTPKPNAEPFDEREFLDELLEESARSIVYRRTKNVRELLVARAVGSSLAQIAEPTPESEERKGEADGDLEKERLLLKDWFERHNDA
ncbi:MAG: hypothetical protein J6K25_08675 [Thermoguttaceae bacterium]|nr:hypothetical protein [Thermoguttaceae bacterium]